MDKYDLVLDMIEHPDRYPHQQIEESLSDTETREIYNIVCKTQSSLKSHDDTANVDDEWRAFADKHIKPHRRFIFHWNRAASITALVFTSIAALAIGSAVTVSLLASRQETTASEAQPATGNTAAIHKSQSQTSTKPDSIISEPATQLFEDESLEKILDAIATHHNVNVIYKTTETAQLHLFYRFDPAIPLEETVEQLNSFEQINIHLSGNILTVD